MKSIDTQRLHLRPLGLDDCAAVQKRFPDWEIVKFLPTSVPWPYPADGARGFIEHVALPMMARKDGWLWAITLKDAPEEGAIGVVHLRRESPEGHLGFWLARDRQGKGYMSEAIGAAIDHAFSELDFKTIMIKNATENTGSSRVQQKAGAVLVATLPADQYHGGYETEEIWELTVDRWRAQKGA